MLLMQDDIGHEYKIWIPCDVESDKMDELIQQLVALTGGMTAAAVQGIVAAALALAYTKLTGRSNLLTMTSAELDERFGEENLYREQRVLLVMPFGPFLCLAAFEVLALTPDGILQYLSLLH